MTTSYPGALDTTTRFPADITDDTDSKAGTPRTGLVGFLAQWIRDTGDAMRAVQTELGINPSGTFADVLARLNAQSTCRKTADQTISAAAMANVSDMVLPVTIGGDHFFEFYVPYSAAATSTGVGFGVTVPALNAGGYISYEVGISGRAANPAVAGAMALTTVPYHVHGTASDGTSATASEAVAVANAVYIARVWGVLSNPSASTGGIQLRARPEVAANMTVKKGAFGRSYLN
jgi:hypothetical protein